jgi:cytochrome d ubiquinol oxidase subunit II
LTALCALGAFVFLWRRWYRVAFLCIVSEVILIRWGWAFAQNPYLITPDVTIADAAPRETLQLVLAVLLLGALGLFPSLYYLYRIFKGDSIFRQLE